MYAAGSRTNLSFKVGRYLQNEFRTRRDGRESRGVMAMSRVV